MKKEKSVFETLNEINVNAKAEKKNGLTYLSWAWAWSEVKKHYPDSTYLVYENADGLNYHHDQQTAWVKTGVTIGGIEHIEYLPVLDYRNKSIAIDSLTSFNVNTSIQRSLTKAIARHGLGLYIYAGEDLPQSDKVEPTLVKLEVDDANWAKVLKYIDANKQLGLTEITKRLSAKYLIEKETTAAIKFLLK